MNETKKLYRVNEGKMVAGVCGGVAEYFNIDPTIVRLATVVATFMGFGLIAYIVGLVLIPEKPTANAAAKVEAATAEEAKSEKAE